MMILAVLVLASCGMLPTCVFFDKVVDVPVVLCNGVPQVHSIDGCDAHMVMRVQRSAPHLAD